VFRWSRRSAAPAGAGDARRVHWTDLGRSARAFRVAHAAWAAVSLAALGRVWWSALVGRRDRALAASVGFLALEGGALVVGRGDCPFGRFQARLGDPVPLFELVLPPRAAKAAIPLLAGVALVGIAAAVARSGGPRVGATPGDRRGRKEARS